jgi:hypothetical protein
LFWSLALPIAANEHDASTSVARRIYRRIVEETNVLPKHLRRATSCAGVYTSRLQAPADSNYTSAATIEHDLAVALDERVRTNHALRVDDGIE